MTNLLLMVGVFVASFGVGYVLISKVPPLLHTPLMSMTNAISAVTILGALLLFAVPVNTAQTLLGAAAIAAAAFNVYGGFYITDKMLELFREKRPDPMEKRTRS